MENGTTIVNYSIEKVVIKHLPHLGACDVGGSKTEIQNFLLPNGRIHRFTLKTVESSGNNCLINLFYRSAGKTRQKGAKVRQ